MALSLVVLLLVIVILVVFLVNQPEKEPQYTVTGTAGDTVHNGFGCMQKICKGPDL